MILPARPMHVMVKAPPKQPFARCGFAAGHAASRRFSAARQSSCCLPMRLTDYTDYALRVLLFLAVRDEGDIRVERSVEHVFFELAAGAGESRGDPDGC